MKFWAILLSIATIILSSYPCCEASVPCSDNLSVASQGNESSEGIPHGEHTPCSPFYSCGSCIGFTIDYKTIDIFRLIHTQEETFPIPYIALLPEDVYFYSLKPPQNFEV